MRKRNSSIQIELIIAVISITAAILWAGKVLFFASNSLYLDTTDALPHYTKIEYLAQCISQFKFPSWFPYWYNGATVMQYYPPLSFMLLVPLEIIFHNPTISLKIFIFSSLFIGSIGVWYIYCKHIGRWFGILAAVFYAAQPYFIISLLGWGVIAQAPILAIAPWHLIISINYFKNPRLKTWFFVLLLTLLLLFSHVMHGFMIVLCIIIIMVAAGIVTKRGIGIAVMWGLATALAAGFLGMWWVPGVLPLETPGIPYLSPDSAMSVTANWTWFIPWKDNGIHAHFSGALLLISILSIYFVYKDKSKSRLILMFMYSITVLTLVFSFGYNLPLFKYIPLAKSLVPGRIVTETAIGASILSAYLIKTIFTEIRIKPYSYLFILVAVAPIFSEYYWVVDIKIVPQMNDYKKIEEVIAAIPSTGTNFEKGRFDWTVPAEAVYNYFPYKYNLNIVSGWNIEGTPHNQYLWLRISALANGAYDYIIKKMNDMNVRSLYIDQGDKAFYEKLKQDGFYEIGDFNLGKLLYNDKPSSYFYRQKRNAIAIGKAVSTFELSFPWVVEGKSKNIKDYKLRDFDDYDMILFEEPGIKNMKEEQYFEELIKNLTNERKTVFIEMGRSYFPSSVLDVSFIQYKGGKDAKLVKGVVGTVLGDFYMPDTEDIVGLTGLDETYYSLKEGSITKSINLMGAKYINGSKVYFIGGPLSQLESPSMEYLTGLKFKGDVYKKRDDLIRSALEDVFSNQSHFSKLSLPAFETKNTMWDYKGCSFEYSSQNKESVMISVTYTPRWKIEVDGVKTDVKSVDNLVEVKLPPGYHKVVMSYGITWVGLLGWAVTGISIILLVIAIKLDGKIIYFADRLFNKFLVYLEIRK